MIRSPYTLCSIYLRGTISLLGFSGLGFWVYGFGSRVLGPSLGTEDVEEPQRVAGLKHVLAQGV